MGNLASSSPAIASKKLYVFFYFFEKKKSMFWGKSYLPLPLRTFCPALEKKSADVHYMMLTFPDDPFSGFRDSQRSLPSGQ